MEEDGEKEYIEVDMNSKRLDTINNTNIKNIDQLNSSQYPSLSIEGCEVDGEGKLKKTVNFEKMKRMQDIEWQETMKKQRRENLILCISLIIFNLLSYAYIQRECPYESDQECLDEFIHPQIIIWGGLILFTSWSTIKYLKLIINKNTSYLVCVPAFLLNLYLFIFHNNGLSSTNYSGIFNVLFLILIIFWLILFFIWHCFSVCFIQKQYRAIFFIFIIVSLLGGALYIFIFRDSCNYWNEGIDNNIQDKCQVNPPSICWQKVIDKWQDLSLLLPNCQEEHSQSEKIFKPNEKRFIGYSSKISLLSDEKLIDSEFQKNVLLEQKEFNSISEEEGRDFEVILDKQNQSFLINVTSKSELINQRISKYKSRQSKPLVENVLLIFVSHISRQAMHLKLPKTLSFFKKGNLNKNDGYQSYEFFRYNSIEKNSNVNLQSILYGKNNNTTFDTNNTESKKIKQKSIFEDYQQNGYVTGHSSDLCSTAGGANFNSTLEYKTIRPDHDSASFSCHDQYSNSEKRVFSSGPYSFVRRCLFGSQISEYVLKYMRSFFQAYNNTNKFFFAEFHEGLDLTGETIQYLDQPLSNFLNEMEENHLLENTAILLLSDDGANSQGILSALQTESTKIEANLPGLFIKITNKLTEEHSQALENNQQSLITSHNINGFLKGILDSSSESSSLLSPSLSQQSQCQQLNIDDDNCSCK